LTVAARNGNLAVRVPACTPVGLINTGSEIGCPMTWVEVERTGC
jgi:hypothetical protein